MENKKDIPVIRKTEEVNIKISIVEAANLGIGFSIGVAIVSTIVAIIGFFLFGTVMNFFISGFGI